MKRSVLITGGGSGLGAAVAKHLAGLDFTVFVTYRSGEADLPDGVIGLRCDMADHAALPGIVAQAAARGGRLDALICNAAIQGIAPLGDLTLEGWQNVMDVNLTAPFLLAQAATPHLAQTGGLILLVSSVHGIAAAPHRLAYGTTKAGLIAMARGLAVELAPQKVRALSLVLGPVKTRALLEGARRFFPGRSDEDVLREFASRQPGGSIAEPSEIAELITFLMSDAARHMTGSEITLDGGMRSRLAVPAIQSA